MYHILTKKLSGINIKKALLCVLLVRLIYAIPTCGVLYDGLLQMGQTLAEAMGMDEKQVEMLSKAWATWLITITITLLIIWWSTQFLSILKQWRTVIRVFIVLDSIDTILAMFTLMVHFTWIIFGDLLINLPLIFLMIHYVKQLSNGSTYARTVFISTENGEQVNLAHVKPAEEGEIV